MDITFNFIGMCVANWQPAYDFFTQKMGFQAELNPAYGDWANLGAAWAGYYSETHSLVCELFDQGCRVADRWWGHHQNIRPAIHIDDLDTHIRQLQARGIMFTSAVETRAWGKQIEFETVEGIRWTLACTPGYPVREDFSQPQFGHVAIKTHDVEAQKTFYGTIMGFALESSGEDAVLCAQHRANHPFIVLEPGGESIDQASPASPYPERSQPFFLSFMTPDILGIAQECHRLAITILRPVTYHPDWDGTDMVITDADGNVIQLVQYQ